MHVIDCADDDTVQTLAFIEPFVMNIFEIGDLSYLELFYWTFDAGNVHSDFILQPSFAFR